LRPLEVDLLMSMYMVTESLALVGEGNTKAA
jgi:hypothetical protein